MKESKFWNLLKPMLPGFAFRVENSAGAGNPDVEVLYKGRTYYFELKATERKTMDEVGALGLLRASQKLWHWEAAQQGVDVYTLIHYGNCHFYLASNNCHSTAPLSLFFMTQGLTKDLPSVLKEIFHV